MFDLKHEKTSSNLDNNVTDLKGENHQNNEIYVKDHNEMKDLDH